MVLVGYWPLNESSEDPDAPTAKDHSGNEIHGKIIDGGDSTVPGATGILGQNAYSFDGSNDYIDVGSLKISSGRVSVSAWVYDKGLTGDRNTFISSDEHTSSEDQFVFATDDSSGNYNFWIYDSTYYNVNAPKKEDSWVHLAGVYDGSRIKLYENGELVAEKQHAGSMNEGGVRTTIGSRSDETSDFFNGFISELRVYNHALTPREVQYLYRVSKRGRLVTSRRSS